MKRPKKNKIIMKAREDLLSELRQDPVVKEALDGFERRQWSRTFDHIAEQMMNSMFPPTPNLFKLLSGGQVRKGPHLSAVANSDTPDGAA